MDRQRSRWNQPAVVAPRSDRALPIEQRHTNDPFLPKSGAMVPYPQSFAAKPTARARRPLRRPALYDSGRAAPRPHALSPRADAGSRARAGRAGPRRRPGHLRHRERQGRDERGVHPHRLLPAVRVRDEHAPDEPGPPQGAAEGRAQGARARGPRARRLVAARRAMAADEVRYERVGPAAVLTIDRPERRNAIDGPTAERLARAYEAFAADDGARVLVVTGAGGVSFCAGADLKAIETFAPRLGDPGGPLGFTRRIPAKPAIAAIEGWCLAGGLELALWCDLRIATGSSTLGFPERRFGVPLIDGGTQRLPRIVGLGRALDLILTGRLVGADEALGLGLLTEVVGRAGPHPLDRALAIAEALAAFPQQTMLADRRAAYDGLALPLADGLAVEARNAAETFADATAGAARFAAGEGRGGAGAGV